MSHQVKILLGYVTICLLWGSSWAAVKIGLESVPPVHALLMRFSIASIVFGGLVIFNRYTIPRQKKFWKLVAVICLSSLTFPMFFIYWGQAKVNSGLAAVLFATYPFWVGLISSALLPQEKINLQKFVGMLIGFGGVVLMFLYNSTEISGTVWGMVAILIGSIFQAFGLVAIRKWGEDFDPVTLNFYSMFLSVLPLVVAAMLFEREVHISLSPMTAGSILYLGIFCTVVTFAIYYWLVKHIQATILSLSALITPAIAVIIGALFMNESFSSHIVLGICMIFLGVGIASVPGMMTRRIRNEK
jgi:drug/metabolite transporter (DMT)-like permease